MKKWRFHEISGKTGKPGKAGLGTFVSFGSFDAGLGATALHFDRFDYWKTRENMENSVLEALRNRPKLTHI